MPGSPRWVGVGSGSGQGFVRGPSPAGDRGGAVLRPTGVVVFATLESPGRPYGLHGEHQAMSLGAAEPSVSVPTSPYRAAGGTTAPVQSVRRGLGHVVTWLLGR